MDEWIGIYKGLRLPFLGFLILAICVYVYWPRAKKRLEEPRFNMLDDEFEPDLSEKHKNSTKLK